MNTPSIFSSPAVQPSADIYTDLNSLQKIKLDDKDEALKKVAQQFESLFVHMMLKSMRSANAVFEEDSLFNSQESKYFRDMQDHQLSLTISHGKGVGIAEALYKQLSRAHGDGATPENNTVPHAPEQTFDTKNVTEKKEVARTPEEFVAMIYPHAKKAAQKLGVDETILIAQSALETGWGQYVLADNRGSSHNVFNIKNKADWNGETVKLNALEYKNGVVTKAPSEFKKYSSIQESFEDYTRLIMNHSRYQKALDKASDAESYISELQNAGYATDPDYAKKILSIQAQLKTGSDAS